MALDTRGLASGFAQGFGLTDNYYTRQEQGDRAERGLQMQEESFDMKKEQFQGEQEKEKATLIMGKIAQNLMPSDDELQWLKERPNYLTALNPETDKAIEIAQRVIDPQDELDLNSDEGMYALNTMFEPMINRGKGGEKRIAAGLPGRTKGTMAFDLDVEGEDGTKTRKPMTQNRGVEGEDDTIREVPVESLVNATQGVRMLRNVINTNGASENAAKLYSLLTGKTPERTKGLEINGRLVNPETGEVIGDFRDEDNSKYGEPFEHPQLGWVQPGPDGKLQQMNPPDGTDNADWRRLNDGSLYNQRTGETKAAPGGAGRTGKAPADVQTAEWMVDNGMAPNLDVAFNRVNESRTDPARFVNDFVTQEMKFQESSGVFPGDESYRAPDQMREQAIETLSMIRSRTRGTGEAAKGSEPKGLEIVGANASQLPADGSAVQQKDGSYSGRVNRNPQPASAQSAQPAPPAAVDLLKKNPQLAEQFKAKYGYLPEGF